MKHMDYTHFNDTEEIIAEAHTALADPRDFIAWLYDQIDEGDDWVGETGDGMTCPIHEYLTDVTGSDEFDVEGDVVTHRADPGYPIDPRQWGEDFVVYVDEIDKINGGGPVTAQTALLIMRKIMAGRK